jgi:hypothetical protein
MLTYLLTNGDIGPATFIIACIVSGIVKGIFSKKKVRHPAETC